MQPFDLTQQEIFRLMKAEWLFQSDFFQIHKTPLNKLGLTQLEVNLFLNKLEWQYDIDIQAENICLNITLAEFIQLIIVQSKKRDKDA